MFGGSSSPFGQSSSSPFGSQSPFGQNNVANNPFASQPFGSPNPFGSQTGAPFFGSTSTGVFGQSSSPLSSTPTFGATSSPGFGSSTPAFGSTSSSFGGSSAFGQKPAFGGFGTNTQTSPFGGSFQQSQGAFGSNLFGSSSPFGASSQPSFGATSSPAFGSSTTPAFGSSNTPAFGSTPSPAFGSTGTSFGVSSTPAFGAGGAFGSTSTSVFGAATAPSFGANTTPAFGGTTTPAFGATTTPAFGATTTPAFGASTTPPFGSNSSPSFSFGSSPAFGQTTSTFGSTPFGNTSSPFGTPSSPFGAQPATPTFGNVAFGQPTLGGQSGGSRVVPYSSTPEDGASSTQPTPKLESISAMAAYKYKSHEELRWEDYQRGDKGGPNTAGQSTPGLSFGATPAQSNPFSSSTTFSQMTSNPFSTNTTANPFNKTPGFGSTGFGTTTSAFGSSPFGGASTSSPFGSTTAPTSSLFATSSPAFGSNTTPSPFGTPNSSPLGSTSVFGSSATQGTAASFGSTLSFGNTQSSPLFQSTTPAFGQTGSTFGQTSSSFGQTAGFSSSLFNPSTTGFGTNLFSSTPSFPPSNFGQTTPSLSTPFQPTPPAQTASAFNFSNFGQNQSAGTGGFGIGSGMFGQNLGQLSSNQNTAVPQPVAVTNPFGTLPAMPHMSIGNSETSPSVQYGISSMPVVDKPILVRISSLLTSRHLSQRRMRLPARKYHPKNDGSRVAFFTDEDEVPSTPKADALFIPRENPRALVIRPVEHWPSKSSTKEASVMVQEDGKTSNGDDHLPNGSIATVKDNHVIENGAVKERQHPNKTSQKPGGSSDDSMNHKGDSYITLSGHRAGEAAIVYEHGADIEAMMPKLRHSDYYTEPRIQELAAKERVEPGFCRNVKDFVVGRHGYGSIKFLGKTDVRRLDLESLVQFNNREVIVYVDDSKKPPIGQGLNKPAEVTLLNIKCYDKKTGNQILEGPRIEKYKAMLKKKAEDQGAEFLSYDPAKGEWKFRVSHFSKYMLSDELCDIDGVSAFC